MTSKRALILILFLFLLLAGAPACEAAKIRLKFNAWDGPELRVYMTRPVGLAPDRPVVFVMHGMNRDASENRDRWHELAKEHDFLLVVPEFSQRKFPGSEKYSLGHVFDETGAPRPETAWSFSAIERIFDAVRERFSMTTDSYSLYGHSAGAQFVHRFIFHMPDARARQIVAANAAWYMMPDFGTDFPYGLNNSVVDRTRLGKALQLPVTILLGELNTNPEDEYLRRTSEAMAQGKNALERGSAFYEQARKAAEQLNVPFNWRLATVQNVGHDNRLMAPAAIPYLLAE